VAQAAVSDARKLALDESPVDPLRAFQSNADFTPRQSGAPTFVAHSATLAKGRDVSADHSGNAKVSILIL
jgi:hypothetical protein